jgi:hypothetical protein
MNVIKHFPNLISSQFLGEYNFDVPLSFLNISSLSHFRRIIISLKLYSICTTYFKKKAINYKIWEHRTAI